MRTRNSTTRRGRASTTSAASATTSSTGSPCLSTSSSLPDPPTIRFLHSPKGTPRHDNPDPTPAHQPPEAHLRRTRPDLPGGVLPGDRRTLYLRVLHQPGTYREGA